MARFRYPVLAREGTCHLILVTIAALAATWWLGAASVIVWVGALFVFQFFRDPGREIPEDPGVVVSPASGKIVSVSEERNPYAEKREKALKVSVFMTVFSVHSNLVPVAGSVKEVRYFPGRFVNASLSKASSENERNAIHIQTDQGHDVYSVQIAGLVARRILCYVNQGDVVETGQRYGFIRFGSRVDLYLPLGTRLEVKLGQWVDSGNSAIGYLPGY